jgi:steroid 5-alpha reductase family enzyme
MDFSGTHRFGWAAIAAPVTMYWILRYVSGVPPLEQHMLETRRDAFLEYQRKVPVFFPRLLG